MIGIRPRAEVLLRFMAKHLQRLAGDLERVPGAFEHNYRARMIGDAASTMRELFKRAEPWETPAPQPAPEPGQLWIDESGTEAFRAAATGLIARITVVSDGIVQYERHGKNSGGAPWTMERAEWPSGYRLLSPVVGAYIDRTLSRGNVATAARVIQVLREELTERPAEEAFRAVELAFGTIDSRD